jgi:hypothetical protein
MIKPSVFVLEPCNIDVSDASRFGAVKYVFNQGDRRSSIWDDKFLSEIVESLTAQHFNPRRDFFVVAGHMVPIALAVAALAKSFDSIKLLLYASTTRNYVEKAITTYDRN